jgi:hypothetical protein
MEANFLPKHSANPLRISDSSVEMVRTGSHWSKNVTLIQIADYGWPQQDNASELFSWMVSIESHYGRCECSNLYL